MDSAALFLIIDDDSDLLDGMARILRRDGHRVVTASTGVDGCRLAQELLPDIAVVDVMLPDINGVEVCKRIQAEAGPGKIDTILISSTRFAAEDQAEGFNAGVCEYLSRPITNKEFSARVIARLKDKQTRDALKLDRNKARKKTDQERAKRFYLEEELQAVFSYAPICMFLTDGDARLVKANPAYTKIFGGDAQAIIGEPCGIAFDCIYNGDHAAGCGFGSHCADCGLRSAITDTFVTGKSHIQVESYLHCRQEDRIIKRLVRFSTSLVMFPHGNRVFVCIEDITESKKSAIALQKSEELFRRIFDQSPIGAAMVGFDRRFLKVNQELCRITGYQADELLNLRFSDITFSEDLELNLKQAEEIAQGVIDQYEMDKRYIRKDGTPVWVRLSVRLIRDDQGEPLYSLPMMVEIDDRKRLEKEKEVQLELFRITNEGSSLKKMVEKILSFLKTWSGVDAIAIRLRRGSDYPYYQTVGYSKKFTLQEKSLLSQKDANKNFVEPKDCVQLECMCGCVINRLTDSSLPFFTPGGSFYTNSTSRLLSESDSIRMPPGIRKHCNEAGYESVLLIPLKVGEKTLGLIQLNHKKEDHFTPNFIALMERLGGHISVAVEQRLADEQLKAKQNELEETNSALKVILRSREQELQEHDQEILMNVRQLVLPCIERLKLGALDIHQQSQLKILEDNLQTITTPFAKRLSSAHLSLTPSLIQVADMIKKGLTNKEMAKLLGISVQSVETYRKRIRAKLKLHNSKVNLRAHLMSMD